MINIPETGSTDWIEDCMKWRRRVLMGRYRHWCSSWDFLPIDETCDEWPCDCTPELLRLWREIGTR
jgi:hypothetical protein